MEPLIPTNHATAPSQEPSAATTDANLKESEHNAEPDPLELPEFVSPSQDVMLLEPAMLQKLRLTERESAEDQMDPRDIATPALELAHNFNF